MLLAEPIHEPHDKEQEDKEPDESDVCIITAEVL